MAGRKDPRPLIEVLRFLLNSPDGQGEELVSNVLHHLGRVKCHEYKIQSVEQLEHLLRRYPQIFSLKKNEVQQLVSVKATTTLTFCVAHSNVSGSCTYRSCSQLHLCIFFLLSGDCSFKGKCLFGHDLSTPHNRRKLEEHLLYGLGITELRTLLCFPWVRQEVTVPKVCRYYNKHAGCTKGQNCRCLHLCHSYVMEKCKFGKGCRRNHYIQDPQVTKVLTSYGVKVKGRRLTEILAEVRAYVRDTEDVSEDQEDAGDRNQYSKMAALRGAHARARKFGSVPNLLAGFSLSTVTSSSNGHGRRDRCPSADRRPRQMSERSYSTLTRDHAQADLQRVEEICLYNLAGNCRFGEMCNRMHCKYPYLWRITAIQLEDPKQEVTWRDLDPDSNDLLERKYCQPDVVECDVLDVDGTTLKVNLKDFTAKELPKNSHRFTFTLRRLSTPSSGDTATTASRHCLPASLVTVWLWYWRNEEGVWNEFGLESMDEERLSLNSDKIERHFLTTPSTPMKFDQHVLDLNRMRLKSVQHDRKFKVRRRPQPFLRVTESSESDDESPNTEEEEDEEDEEEDDEEEAITSEINSDEVIEYDDFSNRLSRGLQEHVEASVKGAEASLDSLQAKKTYLVELRPETKKYETVKSQFCGTLGKRSTIISIHSVNNSTMASTYHKKRCSLSKQSGKERTLYYAPQPADNIAALCEKGINCRRQDGDDMPLGKGGYFHANAARADRNIGALRKRQMFVAQCQVGASCIGAPGLTQPPLREDSNPVNTLRYDSCTDDLDRPRTYVIFDGSRVCFKFLITYSLK